MEPSLKQYVLAAQAAGKSRESIYQALLNSGWKIEEIAGAFVGEPPASPPLQVKAVPVSEEAPKHTVNLLTTIGAILIGLGIFAFVASNWQYLNKPLKVVIILAALVLVNIFAWYMREKKEYPRAGGALYLLGGFIYGAAIFLLAQIFNIRVNWPDGYMLWMLGCVLMGFAVDFSGLFYLAILLGLIAIVGQPFLLLGNPLSLSRFALTSSLLLLLCVIISALAGWNFRKRIPEQYKGYF